MTSHKYVWETEGPRFHFGTGTTGPSSLDDGFSENTVMRDLEHFAPLGQFHGLYFQCPQQPLTDNVS